MQMGRPRDGCYLEEDEISEVTQLRMMATTAVDCGAVECEDPIFHISKLRLGMLTYKHLGKLTIEDEFYPMCL